jgi:hypothetical protein
MTEHDRHPPASVSRQRRAPVSWTRSALTSGLLSLAAVAPAAGVAAEPDTGQEGAVGPEHAPDVETDSPNFDPGGDTEPTVEVGVQPSPDGSPEIDPLESEPTDAPETRLAPPAQPAPPVPEEPLVIPMEGVQPGTPVAPGFSIEPPPPPKPQSLGAEPGSRPQPSERISAVSRSLLHQCKPRLRHRGEAGPPKRHCSRQSLAPPRRQPPQRHQTTSNLTSRACRQVGAVRAFTSSGQASRCGRSPRSCWAPTPLRCGSLPRSRGSGISTATGSPVVILI